MHVLRKPKVDMRNTAEVHFSDFGIVAGVWVMAEYINKEKYYPKEFRGQVETVYPRFAVISTSSGYRVTLHLSDLLCSFVKVTIHGKSATLNSSAAICKDVELAVSM
jgi:hypothetical protein